jgi:hypothetical protein
MTSNVRVAQRPRLLPDNNPCHVAPTLPNGFATKAFHFETAIARIECVTERGRWLRSPEILVPSLDGEAIGVFAGFPPCRRPDRFAVNALA